MAMTTARIGRTQSSLQPIMGSTARQGTGDGLIRLTLIAALTGIGGAIGPAVAFALLVLVTTGSMVWATHVLALGGSFLAVTTPTAAAWLLWAVQTRRTIRRLAILHDRADRAACAQLNALLARE
jgi:hypothetical protein